MGRHKSQWVLSLIILLFLVYYYFHHILSAWPFRYWQTLCHQTNTTTEQKPDSAWTNEQMKSAVRCTCYAGAFILSCCQYMLAYDKALCRSFMWHQNVCTKERFDLQSVVLYLSQWQFSQIVLIFNISLSAFSALLACHQGCCWQDSFTTGWPGW